MANPIDTENLRAVLNKVMQSHQLKPLDIKKDKLQISVSDIGQFHCKTCDNLWSSNFSWVTFDLIHLEIYKKWRMRCRCCGSTTIPTFSIQQLESMFDKVLYYYKGENPNADKRINIGYSARRMYHQPHPSSLCEMCLWGSRNCWRQKFYD